uniref:uncharacterized protein LOC120954980 n=1 Tax=Anopheles coluzzii TaxID=1518534 RepID=UPI001AAC977F|nr:uncharacterized protein LOC120954980 [Anopheles coluzzii]
MSFDQESAEIDQVARYTENLIEQMTLTLELASYAVPFDMRCLKCNEHIPKGATFPAREVDSSCAFMDELTTYFKCVHCNNEIVVRYTLYDGCNDSQTKLIKGAVQVLLPEQQTKPKESEPSSEKS